MSTTVTLNASKSARIDQYNPATNFSSGTIESDVRYTSPLLIGFESPTSSLLYKQIADVAMPITIPYVWNGSASGYQALSYYPLKGSWVENTVTYNNYPGIDYSAYSAYAAAYSYSTSETLNGGSSHYSPNHAAEVLKYGLAVYCSSIGDPSNVGFRTTRSTPIPTIQATFLDTDAYIYADEVSPSSGFVPKNEARLFSWSTAQNGYCIGDITIASATIQWKETESGTVNTISCGAVNSYTVPANTFSSDAVYWRVEITDSTGHTSDSAWCTLSTVDVTSTAECVSPNNSVIDGSVANTFSWNHIISTSTLPTGAELQKSTDNSTWSTLATVTGSATSTSIAASTFATGQHYWRVRTANSSGTYGTWSNSVSFVSIASPSQPSVSVTQEPRPTVSWQASEQQGYQVKIGTLYDSGTKFGTETSLQIPMYLDDGSYTVSVRVVNQYGMWSSWGDAPLTVANTPGTAITLSYIGNFAFQWTGGTYDSYAMYRDGELIAVTTEQSYTDMSAIGSHTYFVRGMNTSNTNYGLSNTLTANLSVDNISIYDYETGLSKELKYTTSSYTDITVSDSIEDVLTHITGSAYPMVETSSFKTKSIQFRVAFTKDSDIDDFTSMFGHKVSVRTQRDTCVVGVLDGTSRNESTFYIEYSCTVQQIAEDEVTL